MEPLLVLLLIAGAFVICIPFGVWRARTRKFSVAWFAAIHLPIPFIVILRMSLGFDWLLVPVAILAAIAGQVVGARLLPPKQPPTTV